MKIFVTGALGFMGSHLAERLYDEGNDVFGIDNLSTGFIRNLNRDYPVFNFDLVNDKEQVNRVFAKFQPDIVYHLAAWAHEGLSQFCPVRVTENNYNALLNTLVPSIRSGVKRFVFTSSMSVYGDGALPFSEDMDRNPVDVYGVAKSSGERLLEILSQVHDFEYSIIRPHNVYGPRQNLSDPYRNVVGIFIRRSLQGKPLIIYGDGEQTRAFSYIDDVTPYIARAGWIDEANGEIINVGPTEEHSINELAELISDNIKYEADRPLEVKHAYCTNEKAKRILGYNTNTTLEDGVKKTIKWARELERTTGIAEPAYLDKLELVNERTPKTWVEKSL